MKLHQRTLTVQRARTALSAAVSDVIEKHDLTFAEVFSILSQEIEQWAKYAVRAERHPDAPAKGGDEE
jgi:hypothetical protein